ncbi:HFR095Cp [Eremothecium sinecaudum]|uniref:HFR095Cp n=1 Tax=Eremothecium sinecaudum TaxID=45286 RepID=A0A0X8HV46_9SACH|nr:HFR095Cp [Eremothecium sinecaudum]AMD21950.1 HFR095Cp [Eremothecium sinecaudum]
MPEERLPTYEEVLREKGEQDQRRHNTVVNAPHRPPNRPPFPQQSAPDGRRLPWEYPRGYFCYKCANTGYKLRNGHECRACWRRFYGNQFEIERPLMDFTVPFSLGSLLGNSILYSISPMQMTCLPHGPAMQPESHMLPPGESQSSGYRCGECGGTGQIRFLFDKNICPVCHGVGRIF